MEVISGRLISDSGGGVGGNMLRLTGGSDCCLDLLWRLGRTRLEAAKEMDSGGRSWPAFSATAARTALFGSELAM